MNNHLKTVGAIILALAAIIAAAILFQSLDFGLTKTFAPAYEAVRRQTFEQSQSYNEGMVRDLENLRMAYADAKTPAQQDAIRDTARHRFAAYPSANLPADLRLFQAQLNN